MKPGVLLAAALLGWGTAPARPRTAPPSLPPAGPGLVWDWQLSATDEDIRRQLDGVGGLAFPRGLKLLDIDGFGTSAATVRRLKARGIYTVCYLNAGSYEDWRPDAKDYPARLLLRPDPDWAGETFVDVADVKRPGSALARILVRRIRMCRDKGFDAVEPDNLQNHETTGGQVTRQDQLDFNTWLADRAHEAGLAVFQKNIPDLTRSRDSRGRRLVDVFDAALSESCARYDECAPFQAYTKAGKLVLAAEYAPKDLKCDVARRYGLNMLLKDRELVSPYQPGYVRRPCSPSPHTAGCIPARVSDEWPRQPRPAARPAPS